MCLPNFCIFGSVILLKKTGLFLFTLLGLLYKVAAQDIHLSVQTGHSSAINAIAFSPGDELIASAGNDHKIILWDFLTGRQATVLNGHTGAVMDLAFHPTEKWLVSASADSTVKFWDLQSGTCTHTLTFGYSLFAIHISPDGSSFAVAGKAISLHSFSDLSKKNLPIHPKKNFTAVAFDQTGKLLAFGGEEEDLAYVVDLDQKSVVRKLPAAATDIGFDSLASHVIYTTAQGIGAAIPLDGKGRNTISSDWMLNRYNAFASNGKTLYLANDLGEIRLIDRTDFRETSIWKARKNPIHDLQLSHNGHFLASADNSGRIVVWDLSIHRAVKALEGTVTQINALSFSPDGNELLIGYQDGSLRKTNLLTNQSLLNSPRRKSDFANARLQWSVHEIISFEKDSAILILYEKRRALDHPENYDKIRVHKAIWYFKENYLVLSEQEEADGAAARYLEDRKSGIARDESFLLNDELTRIQSRDKRLTIECHANELCLYEGKSLLPKKLNSQHTDRVTSIAINEHYGFFATAGWDGLIRFRELESGKLLTTLGAFSNGQFIYINPDGYYFSSKKALDYVGFRLNQKVYSFEQFDLIYNRPDLVAAYLPYYDSLYVSAYRQAYQKRLKKLRLTEADLQNGADVPELHYTRNLDQLITKGTITLQVQCSDSLHGLDRLHLRVNGVPEFGRFGRSIEGKKYQEEFEIELNPGTNYFQLFCTNEQGISSLQESFTVEAHKKDIPADLYLIAIGVSSYEESQYDLNYARKDAEDIKRYFNRPFGPFNAVHTKLLVDSSVTLSSIYDLKSFLSEPNPNDVVLFFVAGHGVLDNHFDYYLATHDMDFSNPSAKGIPYDLFEELLDQTKSRKKVLLLDACHSGEIDKEEVIKSEVIESEQGDIKFRAAGVTLVQKNQNSSFDLAKSLFADMRLNNGTTVISSSGGTEFAIESENWRNGAFTYCLLYGLSSGMADLNRNKEITLSEIQEYLLFQVRKLTNGAQTPTSRVENLNNDFRIK